MKIKSAFTQNFYMDPEEVRNAGNRISTVMTGVNGCLEGASVLLGQIVSLAAGVPDGAKCGALISACDYASMAMVKSDFAMYGIMVSNIMSGLADHSEAATNETIMGMEALKIRRDGILNTAIGLRNLVLFKASANNKNLTFEKMRHIYTQQLGTGSEDSNIEVTDSYIAAKIAGVPIVNGRPYINGAYDAKRHSEALATVSRCKMDLPDGIEGRFKSYTGVRDDRYSKGSNQQKLQDVACTDERGFRRIAVEGLPEPAYMVAMGSFYTGHKVGEVFVVALDNGTVFYCVTGDEKDDDDTDPKNQYRLDGTNINNANIVEFLMDENDIDPNVEYHGDVGKVYEDMSGAVVSIIKLDNMPSVIPED